MKFFVPSPGHINSLKELLKAKDRIYSIFMAGSMELVLNSSCYAGYYNAKKGSFNNAALPLWRA